MRKPKNKNLHEQLVAEGVVTAPEPHNFEPKPKGKPMELKPPAVSAVAAPVAERKIATLVTGIARSIEANIAAASGKPTNTSVAEVEPKVGLARAIAENLRREKAKQKTK